MSEGLKEHAWKACVVNATGGSNPPLSDGLMVIVASVLYDHLIWAVRQALTGAADPFRGCVVGSLRLRSVSPFPNLNTKSNIKMLFYRID